VYRLDRDPATCVRFDRHAVYLGQPGGDERCPADAVGRTDAILVQPLVASSASASLGQGGLAAPASAAADASGGSMARLVDSTAGVVVTATWAGDPTAIRTALHVRSLEALASASRVRPAPRIRAVAAAGQPAADDPATADAVTTPTATSPTATAHIAAATTPAGAGQIYTGTGFDVCSTPSSGQMSAWGSSSYHAIGVYVGGANMACAQPNLTASWVAQESAAGWHLIPIYVGLQAPSNECGCRSISPGSASAQGQAAAQDAVAQAQAVGLGPGNPIEFDMEGYSPGGTNTSVVLAFLAAWTQQLHADGYLSGVYSSGDSGISDLVSQLGAGYLEPDDIWVADWNGAATTTDSFLPTGAWGDHQRLHQYSGGVNQTYGGVTLNIDQDYVDAATAAAGSAATSASGPPQNDGAPSIGGTAMAGQTLTERHGIWSGTPTSYAYAWEDCDSAGNSCAAISGAAAATYVPTTADVGDTIRVVETATNASGTGSAATSAQTAAVLPAQPPSYWLYTAFGNIYQPLGTPWYGSPFAGHAGDRSITGMAATPDRKGYWLVDSAGKVFAYGDAAPHRSPKRASAIIGIAAAPKGGYWLYTASGNVYEPAGTPWYGSPVASYVRDRSITGMAAAPGGKGYWLVDSAGKVYSYGDAAPHRAQRYPHPIVGIVAAPGGGYWLFTAFGNVFEPPGTPWYGSPSAGHAGDRSIGGMAVTPDGKGYWLVDSSGKVYAFGDAVRLARLGHAHPLTGIAAAGGGV
jgi:Domain of unknown function (DUF1906)